MFLLNLEFLKHSSDLIKYIDLRKLNTIFICANILIKEDFIKDF